MQHLVIVGFGDVAGRALPALAARFRVTALVRSPPPAPREPEHDLVTADLDDPATLRTALRGAEVVIHLAPPQARGTADQRTANLLAALQPAPPRRIVYVSTSGVYGDCGGQRVDEDRAPRPATDRARRRLDAEQGLARFASAHATELVVLRAPGIYAADRLPLERLRRGTPVLRPEDDVWTNHVHAEDLAAMVVAAATVPGAGGTYNASDDSEIRMGDWFDLVADRQGLPRPPRIPRSRAASQIPAALLSFMAESRRLVNSRIKEALGVALAYPRVQDGVPCRPGAQP